QGENGRQGLSGAAGETRSQQMRGGVGEVSIGQARAAETAESALRANPLLWLRDLAQQTGGVTIAETNDYRAPLRTAMEEVRTYYEASYAPHSAVYAGLFDNFSIIVVCAVVLDHSRRVPLDFDQDKGRDPLFASE